jgi:hypothetical protein
MIIINLKKLFEQGLNTKQEDYFQIHLKVHFDGQGLVNQLKVLLSLFV